MRDGAFDGAAQAIEAGIGRAEPSWPGFRAGRLITLRKMRREARAAAMLVLLIVGAIVAVLGATSLGAGAYDLGSLLGLDLRASEPTP
ncbi:hypothetical protein [Salinarimonas ramus]|uniref:Uncharacterized protein n=1 Tax=Salinarimonas ramus TaxID=690164 RepID=A0A917QH28_9HYPH|nr:hypothetical protein [Salinarimonas ramus]GGK50367.1 hypothetical protein GCM10011322_41730 [Salinarimonas ramus]